MNGRILIVDDVATNRIVYRARLEAAFYEPLLAADGAECLARARDEKPDLILLDLELPDLHGTEVLRRLRSLPVTRDIPVIALTAQEDGGVRVAAFLAGADDVVGKPASEALLLARVRNLLRSRADAQLSSSDPIQTLGFAERLDVFERAATIAFVAARPQLAAKWLRDLEGQTPDKVVLLSRSQALADTGTINGPGSDTPEIFIIGDELSGANAGLRLLSELKSHPATRYSAVCVVGARDGTDRATMAFDLGADDVVDPDVSGRELALRMRSLLRRKRQSDRQRASVQDGLRLAAIDPLTGLHNRRFAMPKLAGIAAKAAAEGEEFAVMVVDLDRFKLVNDRLGHAAGDQVLTDVAKRLSANLRAADLLARIGGEEFLVVLPGTAMAEARQVAERLCKAIEETPIRLPSGQALTVTVSIGLAVSLPGHAPRCTVDALVEQADLALLDSKNAGRNQVTFRLTAA